MLRNFSRDSKSVPRVLCLIAAVCRLEKSVGVFSSGAYASLFGWRLVVLMGRLLRLFVWREFQLFWCC